jgi:hypothetical protein
MSRCKPAALARPLLVALASLALATGCLFHTKEDADDGGVIGGGTLELEGFPVAAEGIDPSTSEEEDGGSSSGVGEWCQLFIDCVCEEMPSSAYDDCVATAEDYTESQCQETIETYFDQCLED